ncbi:MAG TPA: type I restriction enzyme endonuclease domain-containing protein [Candidatus Acidoferrum sp.]|nr:type I restriction enzyme endonuclease domain-containing protein [Candidatus Acidoferrum sp.]
MRAETETRPAHPAENRIVFDVIVATAPTRATDVQGRFPFTEPGERGGKLPEEKGAAIFNSEPTRVPEPRHRNRHRRVDRAGEVDLSDDEVAFYDALEVNDSAVKVLGDENLRFIARELLKTIRENVSIDWTVKGSVRAKLRVMVKRILRKLGYPADKQEKATQTVLQQAELLCADRAG